METQILGRFQLSTGCERTMIRRKLEFFEWGQFVGFVVQLLVECQVVKFVEFPSTVKFKFIVQGSAWLIFN